MEIFSTPVGSLVPSTLIVYQEFPVSCLILSVTTDLTAAISSFCISELVYVAFRGIVFMIAHKRWFFSRVDSKVNSQRNPRKSSPALDSKLRQGKQKLQ